jgi:hypothetical protein
MTETHPEFPPELEGMRAPFERAAGRRLARRHNRRRSAKVALLSCSAVAAVSASALAAGSATGVIRLGDGTTAKSISASEVPDAPGIAHDPDALICHEKDGVTGWVSGEVARTPGGDTSGCRTPTADERAEQAKLEASERTDYPYNYEVGKSGSKRKATLSTKQPLREGGESRGGVLRIGPGK